MPKITLNCGMNEDSCIQAIQVWLQTCDEPPLIAVTSKDGQAFEADVIPSVADATMPSNRSQLPKYIAQLTWQEPTLVSLRAADDEHSWTWYLTPRIELEPMEF